MDSRQATIEEEWRGEIGIEREKRRVKVSKGNEGGAEQRRAESSK